ncbi:MAG: hypothetical protein JO032_00220 [Alphaproteobacteria bacterium]|nr:hypothetical protein [Alphaproteobacteria bacterium]
MIIGPMLGWLVLLLGLMVLVRDLLMWLDIGRWIPLAVFDLWPEAPAGPVWICPVLLATGAALLLWRRPRPRIRRRPFARRR